MTAIQTTRSITGLIRLIFLPQTNQITKYSYANIIARFLQNRTNSKKFWEKSAFSLGQAKNGSFSQYDT